jgi:hypothetical protein
MVETGISLPSQMILVGKHGLIQLLKNLVHLKFLRNSKH